MQDVHLLMWGGLVIYLALIAWLSYLGARRTHSMSAFAIAEASLGPVVLGLAFAATWFSAAVFVGYPGWSYQWGFSSLWIFVAIIGGGGLGIIATAKRARRMNIRQASLSLPDWLGDRYNSDFVRVSVALVCFFNIFYIAAQFAAGGWIFNTLLGVPYEAGVGMIALIVVLYVFAGGSYADIYTDAVQSVMMIITGVVVFVSAYWMFDGGITGALTEISQQFAASDPNWVAVTNPESGAFYSSFVVIGTFLILFAFASQPQLFNKVLALKKPQHMGLMIAIFLAAGVLTLLVIFGGFYAAATVEVDNLDQSLLTYVNLAFPPVVAALLGLVVIAAVMSTTDGLFVVMSTAIANDIYLKFLVKRGIIKHDAESAEQNALRLSRWSVVLVGIVASLIVLKPPGSIAIFIWIGISGVASGTIGPLMVGLFFPKLATRAAACWSVLGGLAAYSLVQASGAVKNMMAGGGIAVVAGLAIMLVVGYLTRHHNDALAPKEIEHVG